MASFKTQPTLVESGVATLTLANTTLDPLGEIEIVEVLDASYVRGGHLQPLRGAHSRRCPRVPAVCIQQAR